MTTTTTRSTVAPRMANPAQVLPDAYKGIGHLLAAVGKSGLPATTAELIGIRTSQINGCAACLEGHLVTGRKAGLTDSQIVGTAAWAESPFFDDAEKAALALTEALTRVADDSDPVPDELWEAAGRHYDESQLAGILVAVATHNLFNRINIAVREPAAEPFWTK